MFVTNWISTTKIQKISEITNFFRHYFLSRTEVSSANFTFSDLLYYKQAGSSQKGIVIPDDKKTKLSFIVLYPNISSN